MAELTQTELETKIAAIDAEIASLITGLGSGGTDSAALVDYKIGEVEVRGSQRLEQLQALRKTYQDLLEKIPYATADVSSYDVKIDGRDNSDLLGDE